MFKFCKKIYDLCKISYVAFRGQFCKIFHNCKITKFWGTNVYIKMPSPMYFHVLS